jgi:hypothetical protein
MIKLLEQSLHGQNRLCLIFQFVCVIHGGPAGGRWEEGGAEGGWVLDESKTISQKLHLIGWC